MMLSYNLWRSVQAFVNVEGNLNFSFIVIFYTVNDVVVEKFLMLPTLKVRRPPNLILGKVAGVSKLGDNNIFHYVLFRQ